MNARLNNVLLICLSLILFTSPVLSSKDQYTKTIRVGVYQNPPKVFVNEHGVPSGFWVDLVEYIATEENWEIQYVTGNWLSCLENLETRNIDVMMDIAYSGERDEIYDFTSKTVLTDWGSIYAREGLHLDDLYDLVGKKIAVMERDLSFINFQKFDISCQYILCNDYREVAETINSKKADAGILSRFFGMAAEKNYNKIEPTAIVLPPLLMKFAFPLDSDPELIKAFDNHIVKLKDDEDSIYYSSLLKWALVREVSHVPHFVKYGLMVLITLVLILFTIAVILRNRARKSVEKLDESQARYLNTLDQMMEGAQKIDRDWKYDYINKAAKQQFGIIKDDVIGESVFDVFPNFKKTEMILPIRKCMEGGVAERVEEKLERKDGTVRWFGIHIQPVEEGVLILSMDITDHKIIEIEQNSRIQAERANQAKSLFLSQMSHEIRTPLNAILGYVRLLRKEEGLTSHQVNYLKTINQSSDHLLNIINDILDLAKIESGHVSLKITPFSFDVMMENIKMMFYTRAEEKGLKLTINTEESVPKYVAGDEKKLRQIFLNLLSNAMKHTMEGKISVRVSSLEIEGSENKFRLVTEVADTGRGIPAEDLEKIFKPFEQSVDGMLVEGTGLGLPISREFAQLMEGDIWVKSELGVGSTFSFQVVLEAAKDTDVQEWKTAPKVTSLQDQFKPQKILVVDDNKNNLNLMHALLIPIGFEVKEARNGLEAVELFDKWSPHAVLMDMRMPVMDGYEATKIIKNTPKGKHTPVIALTASSFENVIENARRCGSDGYLRKPFREEELFELLKQEMQIDYMYDETEPNEIDSDDIPKSRIIKAIKQIPTDEVSEIISAVEIGDMENIMSHIDSIASFDIEVAAKLRAIADEYDYDSLATIFSEAK